MKRSIADGTPRQKGRRRPAPSSSQRQTSTRHAASEPTRGSDTDSPRVTPFEKYGIPLLLAGALLIAYAPVIHGTFIWDDDAHVTRPDLQSLQGLWRIWFAFGSTQQYYPLLHSAFWVEQRLWGADAVAYHVLNILLHAVSAWLLFLILRRLRVPGAALAAAIFALHPVQVESVAWISEQKNTLSTVFYLAAMFLYVRREDGPDRRSYAIASALFVLGLLTKTVVATLPGALLVIIWWQRGTLSWRRDVVPLVPWFVAGALAGGLTAWFERGLLGADGTALDLSVAQRVILAGRVVVFYLGKLLWPANLLFVYPRWRLDASDVLQYVFVASVVAVVAICWLLRRRWRTPLAVALLFIGALVPALGFVNVYPFVFSFVADHFQYLASLSLISAAAAALTLAADRLPPRARWIAPAACAIGLATLGTLTWRHSALYRDPDVLYTATLAGNGDCYLCVNNLGMLAVQAGRVDEAARQFKAAVDLNPTSAEAQSNLANVLVEAGAIAEGIDHYQQSLRIAPRNVITRTNLGVALVRAQRLQEAESQFEQVLQVMPDYEPARRNLSVLQALHK
jgi:tetratricopeptide (TPR) repeat protein